LKILVIPAQGRRRQENCLFEASMGYILRPYHKNQNKKYTYVPNLRSS
jgi:hypothetical protein